MSVKYLLNSLTRRQEGFYCAPRKTVSYFFEIIDAAKWLPYAQAEAVMRRSTKQPAKAALASQVAMAHVRAAVRMTHHNGMTV